MSLLARYQKAGGFQQLLKVIETCDLVKREKLLSMVEGESPAWASAVRQRLLTVERILAWDDSVLAEIAIQLPEKVLAALICKFGEEVGSRLTFTFSHQQKQRIREIYDGKMPTDGEMAGACIRLVDDVRGMFMGNKLNPEKFDKDAVIPDDFEYKLGSPDISASSQVIEIDDLNEKLKAGKTDLNLNDVQAKILQFKDQVAKLAVENKKLKTENSDLKNKIDQIRKIV